MQSAAYPAQPSRSRRYNGKLVDAEVAEEERLLGFNRSVMHVREKIMLI